MQKVTRTGYSSEKVRKLMDESSGMKLLDPVERERLYNAHAKNEVPMLKKIFVILKSEQDTLEKINNDFVQETQDALIHVSQKLHALERTLLRAKHAAEEKGATAKLPDIIREIGES